MTGSAAAASDGRAAQYVVVTGAIAAGASTLAEELAARLAWQTHLEGHIEVDNDFFARAAADFPRWGLASQTHFLLASVDRHRALRARLADGGPDLVVVEDRTPFEHTGAYLLAHESAGLLPADEVALLRRLTAVVEREFVVPDLLVYRSMDPDQLRTRVEQRSRPGEGALTLPYLEAVLAAFEQFVSAWTRSRALVVPADADVHDPDQARDIAHQVRAALAEAA